MYYGLALPPGVTVAPEAPPPRLLTDQGWVALTPLAVWSIVNSRFEALPIEALTEALIWAEKQHCLDRIDERNGKVSITVPANTTKTKFTAELSVSEGEVWYLAQHLLCIRKNAAITAGALEADFLVSCFPKLEDGSEKPYYGADARLSADHAAIAAGDVCDLVERPVGAVLVDAEPTVVNAKFIRDFRNGDELGTELRLVEGDKLTLVVYVTTAPDVDVTVDLIVWGRKGKRLAPPVTA